MAAMSDYERLTALRDAGWELHVRLRDEVRAMTGEADYLRDRLNLLALDGSPAGKAERAEAERRYHDLFERSQGMAVANERLTEYLQTVVDRAWKDAEEEQYERAHAGATAQ